MIGLWVLLAAVALALALGLLHRARDGRVRPARPARPGRRSRASRPVGPGSKSEEVVTMSRNGDHDATTGAVATATGHDPLARVRAAIDGDAPVTLVQLSTTFCQPCRHTRVLLDSLAADTEGLRHVELDLTERPELADPLRVHRTPTTIAYRPDGTELFRLGGVPRRGPLLEALRPHLTGDET